MRPQRPTASAQPNQKAPSAKAKRPKPRGMVYRSRAITSPAVKEPETQTALQLPAEEPKREHLAELVAGRLKNTKEQRDVVGPLVLLLVEMGWELEQMVFGKTEWRVPKTPSEAAKREKHRSFDGFPCDIAIFDSPKRVGDPKHLLVIIECKQPHDRDGLDELENYLSREPHAKLGVFANDPGRAAAAHLVFKRPSGALLRKRSVVADIPRPGEKISPKAQRLTYTDLALPSEETLKRSIEHLLDRVVANDPHVTRREDQLDQLCDLLLLKLESDREAKAHPTAPPGFRVLESERKTAEMLRERFEQLVRLYPEVFIEQRDRELRFSDASLNLCAEELSRFRLLELGIQTVSVAFQVLRAAALKQGEGQYFTPHAVIEAGVRLMNIQWSDIVIDPACGTGGFLVQTMIEMQRRHPNMTTELSRWAQSRLYGIDKDKIGVKLTKAIMQIAGDGSAHCVRGDSVRTHTWQGEFAHLAQNPKFRDGRFSVVLTNPPFGANLKVSAEDTRLSGLEIARAASGHYEEMEIGLLFLQRAYDLLCRGGRLGIILPETYFFSVNYGFLLNWLRPRFAPRLVANVPMEAFQGFCRAKTNFYVFEKI